MMIGYGYGRFVDRLQCRTYHRILCTTNRCGWSSPTHSWRDLNMGPPLRTRIPDLRRDQANIPVLAYPSPSDWVAECGVCESVFAVAWRDSPENPAPHGSF